MCILSTGVMGLDLFDRKGFIGDVARFVRYGARKDVTVYAANAGYFLVLSLFPLLVLLLGLLRNMGLATDTLLDALEGVIPGALMPAAKKLILSTYQNVSGAVLSVSALTALWSASRGIYGLLTGLNRIYEVQETRGWLRTRAMSVLYTFLFLLVLVLTLILSVFGKSFVAFNPFLAQLVDLHFFVLLAVQTTLFTAMFMVLPSRNNTLRESVPGAVLASGGWLIFSDLYSIYVEHFAGLSSVYGSVYAVALSMLWLYICLCMVFYGGAWNHYRIKKKNK